MFDFHFALKTMEGIDEDHDLEDDYLDLDLDCAIKFRRPLSRVS